MTLSDVATAMTLIGVAAGIGAILAGLWEDRQDKKWEQAMRRLPFITKE